MELKQNGYFLFELDACVLYQGFQKCGQVSQILGHENLWRLVTLKMHNSLNFWEAIKNISAAQKWYNEWMTHENQNSKYGSSCDLRFHNVRFYWLN